MIPSKSHSRDNLPLIIVSFLTSLLQMKTKPGSFVPNVDSFVRNKKNRQGICDAGAIAEVMGSNPVDAT